MSEVIKSISYNQKEILSNIIRLHNGGKPFQVDMTYSSGKFYSKDKSDEFYVPTPTIKLDVAPQEDDVIKIEPKGKLPFEDGMIQSIVIDLPFVILPQKAKSFVEPSGKTNNVMARRFSSYYPAVELFESYYHWISEAYRVLEENGICAFKCQNTVSGGKNYSTEEYSFMCANSVGFHVLDKFILLARARLISGKVKNQIHARKFSSTFYVWRKSRKLIDYFAILKENQEREEKGEDDKEIE